MKQVLKSLKITVPSIPASQNVYWTPLDSLTDPTLAYMLPIPHVSQKEKRDRLCLPATRITDKALLTALCCCNSAWLWAITVSLPLHTKITSPSHFRNNWSLFTLFWFIQHIRRRYSILPLLWKDVMRPRPKVTKNCRGLLQNLPWLIYINFLSFVIASIITSTVSVVGYNDPALKSLRWQENRTQQYTFPVLKKMVLRTAIIAWSSTAQQHT